VVRVSLTKWEEDQVKLLGERLRRQGACRGPRPPACQGRFTPADVPRFPPSTEEEELNGTGRAPAGSSPGSVGKGS